MLYEFRVYHMNPGKLPDIHKRFAEVTLDLFKEHGIHVCDFYTDATGKESIYYICAFKDMEARNVAFASFEKDPRWIKAFAQSHENGVIVASHESYFMNRVPYITPEWK